VALFEGLVSGLAAGILMGLISHAGFRVGLFKSSLFIVDGTFIQNILRMEHNVNKSVLIGIPVHLITSMAFGIGYVVPITILKLDLLKAPFIAFYIFMLWLSMLFVALPAAGQGLLGRNLGSNTWLEQLALHLIFGLGFWGALYLFQ
jgi:hypothetical protein